MEERNLICIGCPMGCHLTVEIMGQWLVSAEIPVNEEIAMPAVR